MLLMYCDFCSAVVVQHKGSVTEDPLVDAVPYEVRARSLSGSTVSRHANCRYALLHPIQATDGEGQPKDESVPRVVKGVVR